MEEELPQNCIQNINRSPLINLSHYCKDSLLLVLTIDYQNICIQWHPLPTKDHYTERVAKSYAYNGYNEE